MESKEQRERESQEFVPVLVVSCGVDSTVKSMDKVNMKNRGLGGEDKFRFLNIDLETAT